MLDIESIGAVAAAFQRPVSLLERELAQLGIEPAARINGVVYLDFAGIAALFEANPRSTIVEPQNVARRNDPGSPCR